MKYFIMLKEYLNLELILLRLASIVNLIYFNRQLNFAQSRETDTQRKLYYDC